MQRALATIVRSSFRAHQSQQFCSSTYHFHPQILAKYRYQYRYPYRYQYQTRSQSNTSRMTAIQQNLKEKSAQYASSFTHGSLAAPPSKKYVIVTCMDARLDPVQAFGIDIGDAHVIRNAGGNAVDALRSVIISNQLLGTTEIILIKHTKCGMLTFKNEDCRGICEKNLGPEAGKALADFDFQPFPDLDQGVIDDVEFLKKSPAISRDATITGWVYEVETGKTRQVV